jgi:ribonuclease P protein component
VTERTGPFRRSDRLLRSREFQYVARHGRRAVVRGFVVLVAPRAAAGTARGPRLGVTVSRRVGGAVVRNRVKRRIREWFRAEARALPGGVDVVVIGRRAAATLSGAEVSRELGRAASELEVGGR